MRLKIIDIEQVTQLYMIIFHYKNAHELVVYVEILLPGTFLGT